VAELADAQSQHLFPYGVEVRPLSSQSILKEPVLKRRLEETVWPQAGYGDGLPRPLLLPDPDGNAVNDFRSPTGRDSKARTQRSEGLDLSRTRFRFRPSPKGAKQIPHRRNLENGCPRLARRRPRPFRVFCVGFVLHPGAAQAAPRL